MLLCQQIVNIELLINNVQHIGISVKEMKNIGYRKKESQILEYWNIGELPSREIALNNCYDNHLINYHNY